MTVTEINSYPEEEAIALLATKTVGDLEELQVFIDANHPDDDTEADTAFFRVCEAIERAKKREATDPDSDPNADWWRGAQLHPC